jgi:hypothetical protein
VITLTVLERKKIAAVFRDAADEMERGRGTALISVKLQRRMAAAQLLILKKAAGPIKVTRMTLR